MDKHKIKQMKSGSGGSSVGGGSQELQRTSSVIGNKILNHTINNVFKKRICGDIFGSSHDGGSDEASMLGMMYRSRTKAAVPELDTKEAVQEEIATEKDAAGNIDTGGMCNSSGEEDEPVEELKNPRQQLAMTINNWSKQVENDSKLIQEGGVHALIALCSFDDPGLKIYVTSALYNLSQRPENRIPLLNIGAATGIVTMVQSKSWKLSKLCAMTLCNLSMAPGGELTMFNKGTAIYACGILNSVKQHRLLSICAQTLYNLTSSDYFEGMERVIKALLTLPIANGFDATPIQIKGLVNCCRFPQLRERMLDDGYISSVCCFIEQYTRYQAKV